MKKEIWLPLAGLLAVLALTQLPRLLDLAPQPRL